MRITRYITEHWRGELPLQWAFGVNVFCLHALYRGIEIAGDGVLPLILAMGLLRFITAIWQVIGIWRTCGNYIDRRELVPLAWFLRGLIVFGYVWTAGGALFGL
jgi:hypothetical protein